MFSFNEFVKNVSITNLLYFILKLPNFVLCLDLVVEIAAPKLISTILYYVHLYINKTSRSYVILI